MTERVKRQLEFLQRREYRSLRAHETRKGAEMFTELPPMLRRARFLEADLKSETPTFWGDDMFGFNYSRDRSIENRCHFNNVTPDYETVLAVGLRGIEARVDELYPAADATAREFYDGLKICFAACYDIIKRYRDAAKESGNDKLYAALCHVPERGATDYYEALVVLRFMQYSLRMGGATHVTIGRFDKYMKPYYAASVKAGATKEELLETTEMFFIALNLDADLYFGVQQGDNGQSLMLGGSDGAGGDVFGEISEICLQASEELKLIDPKINLRVNKNTPLSLYERGTRLTKQGLGFPQYSNDDVVIPALIKWGYDPEDAADYTVAACWEFIIPAYGADIVNIAAFSMPQAVNSAMYKSLAGCKDFDEFLEAVDREVGIQCDEIVADVTKRGVPAEPYFSAFIRPCVERGRDISACGAKYNNYGVHGAGVSTAADSLAAIKKKVFEEKNVTPAELTAATEADFVGYEKLRRELADCPKMGNNDDYVDELAGFMLDSFARHLNYRPNGRGGIFRAGTGSAQMYIALGEKLGATADGRKSGLPLASGFSPSLEARTFGPLSAIQSFTKFDLTKVCNGGPFTIEIHDTVFRNSEGDRKVAQLIKSFIDLGGHQIQINAINRDVLLDAQKHPEKYPGLIVRVWGWSGYFNEIDVKYQNHIIRRLEYTFG